MRKLSSNTTENFVVKYAGQTIKLKIGSPVADLWKQEYRLDISQPIGNIIGYDLINDLVCYESFADVEMSPNFGIEFNNLIYVFEYKRRNRLASINIEQIELYEKNIIPQINESKEITKRE